MGITNTQKRIMQFCNLLIFLLFFAIFNLSAQPVMDGVYDPEEGWGEAVAANTDAGWAGANAKKLYVTSDATYIYFGAEVDADSWMSWGFVFNASGTGGIPDDVWTYPITYDHDPKPDFVIRGHFGDYSELREWDGDDGHELALTLTQNDKGISTDFVEVRILRSKLDNPQTISVQFYITGDNESEHATFDAVPQDEIADSWNTTTALQNYVIDVDVSHEGDPEDPDEFPVEFTVIDETETYENIEFKGEISAWANIPMIEGPDHTWTLTLDISEGTYEWGVVENDGSDAGIWLLPGDNLVVIIDSEGNVTGDDSFIIEGDDADPEIGWANLQHPQNGSIETETEFVVYARVFIDGITGKDATEDSLEDLSAWIGYSATDATNLSDFQSGWTWIEASLDDYDDAFGNNSQYSADIGSEIEDAGTFCYVSRFKFDDDDYVYGGFDGGYWNGTSNFSGLLTVTSDEDVYVPVIENNNINIYPNPVSDNLTIASETKITYIEIIDLTGRIIHSQPVNEIRSIIPVSKLEKGNYIVRIHTEDRVFLKKVQIQR